MRKVELIYAEVMNETEHLFVFMTVFNKQEYAKVVILNMALSTEVQDAQFGRIILELASITKVDTDSAIDAGEK